MVNKVLNEQFLELRSIFTDIQLSFVGDKYIIEGRFRFKTRIEDITIWDEYDLEIYVSIQYPKYTPVVYETGRRISRIIDNHIYESDGRLCLGVPVAVQLTFANKKNLLSFVNELVIPFLAGYSFKEKYNKWPFGEHSHGTKGLLEYYSQLFQVNQNHIILKLLSLLAGNSLPKSSICPCGSETKFESCHYSLIQTLTSKKDLKEIFREDFYKCYNYIPEKNILANEISKLFNPIS